MKKEVEEGLLFDQELRWRNNKPVCLKSGDVIEVEFDSSKKYAYIKKNNNILEDIKKRVKKLFKNLTAIKL